jgi:hypothetical protein
MPQTSKLGTVATKVRTENGVTVIRYHQTDVVTVDATHIWLNANGWRTATTKNRMNQASNQFNLGYRVYQKAGEWFVTYQGETLPFTDGLCLQRSK